MTRRTRRILLLTAPPLLLLASTGALYARGFGGGFHGGFGGFRGMGGGGFRGMGGMGRSFGGMSGMGGMRMGGYGGGSFARTPSFSSVGTFNRVGGAAGGFRGYNPYAGGSGRTAAGMRAGSFDGPRGGSIDHAAGGRAEVGPRGGMAARGGEVTRVTGPNGRSFTEAERGGVIRGPGGATAMGGHGASAFRPYGYNAYSGYHAGWVHGYWNGHNSGAWGWRGPYWGGWGLGMGGLGWGLGAWGFGSMLYGMGYMPYFNPYYGANLAPSSAYDYAQPLDTGAAPAQDDSVNQGVSQFDAARNAFYQGNFTQALQESDAAVKLTPNDTALHEFRALCLFALERYDEAAATLYAVLSVGPGWDWTTLIGLYADPSTYTTQLRTLEAAVKSHPNSPADKFVLAYHYLTQGHTEAAVTVLKKLVAQEPSDTLSARLLKQLSPPADAAQASTPEPATHAAGADTNPPAGATLDGTWTASPRTGTTISLQLQNGGGFTWKATANGVSKSFSGSSTYGNGILTLIQQDGPVLVGRVGWTDASHFTFRIAGDEASDPGLHFSR